MQIQYETLMNSVLFCRGGGASALQYASAVPVDASPGISGNPRGLFGVGAVVATAGSGTQLAEHLAFIMPIGESR